jgi:TolB-like protein
VIALVALGFPLALIFAWAFELTPEGIKRTEDVAPNESITRKTGRKLIALVAIGATLAAGLLTWQLLRPKSASSEPAGSDAIPHKSIAVLPFQNLSKDEENAFFADGVQEEILTRLAKVGNLKVISRTSTQRFKSAPSDLPAIAKQLGVLHVLEGSVQKSGDAVRVNVQLINALTHAHLWAETYDRKLTDIFAVESDIAKRIADTLQAKLTGLEKQAIAKRPTTDLEAHELYLKGRFFWNKRTCGDLLRAIEQFKAAIANDPNYALAYAGLADSYALFSAFSVAPPREAMPLPKKSSRWTIPWPERMPRSGWPCGRAKSTLLVPPPSSKRQSRSIRTMPPPSLVCECHFARAPAVGPHDCRSQARRATSSPS